MRVRANSERQQAQLDQHQAAPLASGWRTARSAGPSQQLEPLQKIYTHQVTTCGQPDIELDERPAQGGGQKWSQPKIRLGKSSKSQQAKVKRAGIVCALLRHLWPSQNWPSWLVQIAQVILSNTTIIRLAIFLLLIYISTPILKIKCDDQLLLQQPNQSNQNNPEPPVAGYQIFDSLDRQLERQLQQQPQIRNFDGPHISLSQQIFAHQQQQQLMATSSKPAPGQLHYTSSYPFMAQQNESPTSDSLAAILGPHASKQQQSEGTSSTLVEDLLEAAQSKAPNTVSSSAPAVADNEKSAPTSAPSSTSQSGGSSSSSSLLGDQLNAVSQLLQQAGQLGLSAAQQNVALSEAIINGVTNSLTRYQQRRPGAGASMQQQAAASDRPQHQVGQGINGNIEFDSNQQAINGFIEFPSLGLGNLSSKPSAGAALKPLLLAALKTVPIKLGTVGWKLLQLLAWKKIYKTHHPKSAEIVIEQEMKDHSSDKMKLSGFSQAKMGVVDLGGLSKQVKTSKMGQAYMTDVPDWVSMMHKSGGAGIFGTGWPGPFGDSSPTMSASMIYQRHLLPPGGAGSVAGQPSAAAAAAAAAATAAAIQSHWVQQQMAAEEAAAESQQTRASAASNQTAPTTGGGGSAPKRKKASFGSANWFAVPPTHAYAAAAAAANAAAALASQQQHQAAHRHRLATSPFEFAGAHDASSPASGLHQALATGMMYQSLFDNAAAMAVKLPPSDHLAAAATATDFLDQSDSLSGGSFGSLTDVSDAGGAGSWPVAGGGLMQRRDASTNYLGPPGLARLAGGPSGWGPPGPYQRATPDNLLAFNEGQLGLGLPTSSQQQQQQLDSLADFDDTPSSKVIRRALNESNGPSPVYRLVHDDQQQHHALSKRLDKG